MNSPKALLEKVTNRDGSALVLVNEQDLEKANQPPPDGREADVSCSWWRRGRVEAHLEHGAPVVLSA